MPDGSVPAHCHAMSYFQDAVATEAYLGTARRRASVRRHARMLDYPMHEGVNARVWVAVRAETGVENTGAAIGEGKPLDAHPLRAEVSIAPRGPCGPSEDRGPETKRGQGR